jgi:hypothetical protein
MSREPYKPLTDEAIKSLLASSPKSDGKAGWQPGQPWPKLKWGERKLIHSQFSTDYNHNLP